ncbi:OB-fold nucleic acid binding domain-containing protein [Frankia sp. CpI1-P]|uniref:helix-hairpin-helix domain-containing protein n=1 Tax=Frankia sp. CpI1-P TaxID=1502734 RepID=UPI0005D0FC79|nr:OB-fold nucleic acid binding domain-containing protein [Frankia sp. CpI1-P]KQC39201.1 hypothetical protein UK82_05985 [Frankia sp. ACN1ag]
MLRPDVNASAVGASLVGAQPRVRLGLSGVRRVGESLARRIVETRAAGGPYADMADLEESVADLWATGITTEGYPTRFLRERLAARGVTAASGLRDAEAGRRVLVAGIVTHRQRPATAGGTTFVNLEDETGLVNVICSPGVWTRHRVVARTAVALVVHGRLERAEGVTNVIAERMWPLPVAVASRSRDFR